MLPRTFFPTKPDANRRKNRGQFGQFVARMSEAISGTKNAIMVRHRHNVRPVYRRRHRAHVCDNAPGRRCHGERQPWISLRSSGLLADAGMTAARLCAWKMRVNALRAARAATYRTLATLV